MPAADLPALVHRAREAVTRLAQVVRSGTPDASLEADLVELLALVARLSSDVQCQLLQTRRNQQSAIRTSSSAAGHGVHVERFNLAGDRPSEQPRVKPPLSGAWNPGGHRRD